MSSNQIIVTGSAGFIGFHVCMQLLSKGLSVIGIDCITDYYDIKLKNNRLRQLTAYENYTHLYNRIEKLDAGSLSLGSNKIIIVHLAAQAGVRHSIDYPKEYAETNLMGTFNILEIARELNCKHLLVASTSSVYGNAKSFPLAETFHTSTPLSFYAATKKSSEVMAYSYSHLYSIPTTVFRFFTVYGPWGRPDMALFKFTESIINDKPIDVYNYGEMKRDFTYIEDLARAIVLLIDYIPTNNKKDEFISPYRILNIGNSKPEKLMDYIKAIETSLGKEAIKNFMPLQDGDVKETWCDSDALFKLTNFRPETDIHTGVKKFIDWYLDYSRNNDH